MFPFPCKKKSDPLGVKFEKKIIFPIVCVQKNYCIYKLKKIIVLIK